MNTFLPVETQSNDSSLKIRGRVMAYEEFTGRLQRLCAALGFSAAPRVPRNLSWKWVDRREAVIFISCRVSYNPQWGEFGGYPQLFAEARTDDEEECLAAFLAPFLRQYRFARECILLTRTGQGEHFVTLPADLLRTAGEPGRLVVLLDKIAETDMDGNTFPAKTSGAMHTFALSTALRRTLAARGFVWQTGRNIPIGRHLPSDVLSFVEAGRASGQASLCESTLQPHLAEIVTHRTPILRAAELHLGQVFARAVATLADECANMNVLCLAGLDIDMSSIVGHEGHCFVPWRAYLTRRGEALRMEQDDLFVRLMQERNP